MLRIESEVKTDEEQPKMPVAQFLIQHLAEGLGKPIIEAREDTEDDPTEDDVVKVRHDEVGIAQLPVKRRHREHDAGKSGNEKLEKKCQCRRASATCRRIFPPYIVPSQLKILMPVGTAMIIVEMAKKVLPTEVIPTVNMWCAQTPRLMKAIDTVAATMTG